MNRELAELREEMQQAERRLGWAIRTGRAKVERQARAMLAELSRQWDNLARHYNRRQEV